MLDMDALDHFKSVLGLGRIVLSRIGLGQISPSKITLGFFMNFVSVPDFSSFDHSVTMDTFDGGVADDSRVARDFNDGACGDGHGFRRLWPIPTITCLR